MAKENTNKWTLLEYEDWYVNYSAKEWQALIDFTLLQTRDFTYDERSILMKLSRNNQRRGKHTYPELKWAKSIVDRIEQSRENDSYTEHFNEKQPSEELKNLTVRVAWHDNKWNGRICNDPKNNVYCTGYRSLLSDRLRRRKRTDLEQAFLSREIAVLKREALSLEDKQYIPPCFWSINAFGEKAVEVEHDNPAAPRLEHLKESLPAHSVFSWPFAISFLRNERSGEKYPKNLENVRVPKFQNKLRERETIVFLYANYDNPISGDDQNYLVIGCGLLGEKGDSLRFEKPEEEFEKVTRRPGCRNFPHINWALRYSLDYPNNFVRLPYHEYLADAEQNQYFDRLNKIKVIIDEQELIHCFKYVAMDIDDDEAIYILSKIRQKLWLIKEDGIVSPDLVTADIAKITYFLEMAWERRGYFPGFEKLSRLLLKRYDDNFSLSRLFEKLKVNEGKTYADKFLELIENPTDTRYREFKSDLRDLREKIEDSYGLTTEDFSRLCMLNLSKYQFERILQGKLGPDLKREISDISENPYLLFEEYEVEEKTAVNTITGEQWDFEIELFKVDIAYFPNTQFMPRLDLQREMRNNDKRRVRALIIQYLGSLINFGHCFDEARSIEAKLKDYPLFYNIDQEYELPDNFLLKISDDYESHLAQKIWIVTERDTKFFYLKEIYEAEQEISTFFTKLLKKDDVEAPYAGYRKYLENSISKLKKRLRNRFDESGFRTERDELYKNIFKKSLYVVSGAPGSGKSHELLNIIQQLKRNNETYILLSLTGKAVLRLTTDPDFPGIEAKTIDKFIVDVERNKEKPLLYNNVIIDEVSMVDLIKFKDLIGYFNVDNPAFKRLILVGDQYQLPPIGFGKVFIDLIRYLKNAEEYEANFIELEVNCRQELDDKIIDFSKIYSKQNIAYESLLEEAAKGGDLSEKFHISYWSTQDELQNKLKERFRKLDKKNNDSLNAILNGLLELDANGGINTETGQDIFKLDAFQLLAPYRTGQCGTIILNQVIQDEFRKDVDFISLKGFAFKHSDKIIQTRNFYVDDDLFLSNGSMGLVIKDGKASQFYFPERGYEPLRSSEIDDAEYLELAYCITVHKSQGSGFDHVFLIIPKKLTILCRELLYTALTRSRQSLSVFVEGRPGEPYENTLFELIRTRSYTETRKTSLLGLPLWDFSLEPEKGVFVRSRAEYIIYRNLLDAKDKYKDFVFDYEEYPEIDGRRIKIKTDFTIVTKAGKTYYWEHLGLLGNNYYEKKWDFKYGTYKKEGILNYLITTDERRGLNEDKIRKIIEDLRSDRLQNEDKYKMYSDHHYYLR